MNNQGTSKTDDADRRFVARLLALVETMPTPHGRPYTAREIAEGTGLSPHYVRTLLRGGVAMPSAERVQRIATFFGVDASYFTKTEPAERRSESEIDDALRQALADPFLLQVARRSAGMGRAQKEFLLEMIDAARHHLAGTDEAAQRDEDNPDEPESQSHERRRGVDRRRGQDRQMFPERAKDSDEEATED